MERTKTMCSFGNDECGLQTGTVKISELYEFKEHPFKVEQNIQLFELMRSIEDKGVLVPLIVRSNPYGDGYEIIAGHRRKAACEWAGLTEVPVIIRELDDADAVIAMIDSNLQREHIKPSEKAFAYKMKLKAMKSQGKRNDLFPSQVGTKLKIEKTLEGKKILRADERLAKEVGESRNQIARYIRLTNLIPKILQKAPLTNLVSISNFNSKLYIFLPDIEITPFIRHLFLSNKRVHFNLMRMSVYFLYRVIFAQFSGNPISFNNWFSVR